jgi:hypothetical protein
MDLLTLLFRLPLMPLRGFVQLAEAEEARVFGEMSDQDVADVEGQAVGRLVSSPADTSAGPRARRNGS